MREDRERREEGGGGRRKGQEEMTIPKTSNPKRFPRLATHPAPSHSHPGRTLSHRASADEMRCGEIEVLRCGWRVVRGRGRADWGATLGTGETARPLTERQRLAQGVSVLGAVGQRLPAEEGEIGIDDDEYEEMDEGGVETGVLDLSQLAGYGQGRGEEGQDQEQLGGFNTSSNTPIHPPTLPILPRSQGDGSIGPGG